jgi:hypothetical protein
MVYAVNCSAAASKDAEVSHDIIGCGNIDAVIALHAYLVVVLRVSLSDSLCLIPLLPISSESRCLSNLCSCAVKLVK